MFIDGDYEFLGRMYGISGASGKFMLTCESSTVTRSHIGKHCCLYCTIDKDHLRVPLAERGPFPARTLHTLESDHASFMASGGNLKNAKHFNNAIRSPFFKIPLTQVSLKNNMHNIFTW